MWADQAYCPLKCAHYKIPFDELKLNARKKYKYLYHAFVVQINVPWYKYLYHWYKYLYLRFVLIVAAAISMCIPNT